ncbi:family 16 glycosylhydrolase [Rhizobium sp. B21/90]|uniref:glycoside hydrolase family 16 protein n=1 Tax=Rhizobium sp. B21/90 TaxID=2819993 RepID=UPI001C5A70FB|nr:glycoside hydrolase family 16 protein [Rhizobium sp. B21/90]QYA03904.1 glycoside hydrolase family 16 protein [Rhizobium sp. B21/90]
MSKLHQGILVLAFILTAASAAPAVTFKPVWRDDFNGVAMSRLDPTKWDYDLGSGKVWGNNESQTYTDKVTTIRQDGHGNLVITARRQDDGSYTSGRIKTMGRFSLQFGKFEARIKIPHGPGLLPAFWLMGDRGQWPANGEIDVMENTAAAPRTVYSNLHAPDFASPGEKTATGNLSDDFHVYAIEWTPGRVSWLFDGVVYKTVTKTAIPAGGRWIFDDQPYYILLNVAVGGNWPGPPVDSVLPQDMLVDWVSVSSYIP